MKKNAWLIIIISLTIIAVLGLFIGNDYFKKDEGFAEAQSLEGKWIRADGGYTLQLKDVNPDGVLNASYFNPKSINVQQANWKFEKEILYLFVELRDVNYPGSKYSLRYIKERDVLAGTYFQATANQTYDIYFSRMKN